MSDYTILGTLEGTTDGAAAGAIELNGVGMVDAMCMPRDAGLLDVSIATFNGTLTLKIARNGRRYYAGRISRRGAGVLDITLWPQKDGSYTVSAISADVDWLSDYLAQAEQIPF